MNTSESFVAARKTLENAKQVLDQLARTESGVDLSEARTAVEAAVKASADFGGECQNETPYAPLFFVLENGRAFLKCTHKPSHKFELKSSG